MSASKRESGPCFLVASDESFRFDDSVQVKEGLGAFLFQLDEPALADSLIELYYTECSDREFDLTVVFANTLTAPKLVMARRELSRVDAIGLGLGSDDYQTDDPVFEAMGRCAVKLGNLEIELKHVLEKTRASTSLPTNSGYSAIRRFLQPLPPACAFDESLAKLAHVLERHRLLFLFFSCARRVNPSAVRSRSGINELVTHEEIRGYEQFREGIDSAGEFLFRDRSFLDRFADEAIGRFGPGEGVKVDAEGAGNPYWSLDEEGALYLQESAEVIHVTIGELRRFDPQGHCEALITQALEVAFDRGNSRWYSSIVTRWAYLCDLDAAIAKAKRAVVMPPQAAAAPIEASASPDQWFYLSATYDECMFNHAPDALGRVVGDPNYYPVDNGTIFFYKVQGEVLAQRLVRLFDRGVKPYAEQEGETRVRVSFACQRVAAFDEDHAFLIEEQINEAKAEVERLDREWQLQTGPKKRAGRIVDPGDLPPKPRPLNGELLSRQYLYDQAQRWREKLSVEQTEPDVPNGQDRQDASEVPQPNVEPASEEILRVALPTAIIAAWALRELIRVRAYYPDAIPEHEAKLLQDQLADELVSATTVCKLERLVEISKMPEAADLGSDEVVAILMSMLTLHHPDHKAEPPTAEGMFEASERVMRQCQQEVQEPLRSIVQRLIHAMLYDCRIPAPKGVPAFQEPQRFLQMLRTYWGVVRQLVLHHIEAPLGLRPHPLMPLVVNLEARIDVCFSKLLQDENTEKAKGCVMTLIDIVLSGEPDDLQAAPEWSYEQVGNVDRFIEESRLAIGSKSYPLTSAEEMCIEQGRKAIADYVERVNSDWEKWRKRLNARQATSTEHSSPAKVELTAEPMPPKSYLGGEMVFFDDRVEFCGVDVCSGRRSRSRRVVLELLSKRRSDGSFVAYSGEDLEAEAKENGAKGDVGRWIDDLRDNIMAGLRNRAGIVSGHKEVILSGGPGYRFADCVTVRFVDAPTIKDITDTENVPDVRDDDVRDVLDVRDDAAGSRRAWILQQLAQEKRLRAADVIDQFKCSKKTALRDLAALKDEGKIEFVGEARTGCYRLCKSPKASP